MKTSDFDYYLPPECIAQTPVEPRHAARLLVLHRDSPALEHTTFWQLGDYLRPGDVLVVNQTRVIPARLFGRKPTGGRVEVLLLKQEDECTWKALVGGKRLVSGKKLTFDNGLSAEIVAELQGSGRLVRFSEPVQPHLQRLGQMPLPPYIHTPLADPERYQTVYATQPGSAAAPTAGLHFTPELMAHLQANGIGFVYVTLHVGLDTFAPVTEETSGTLSQLKGVNSPGSRPDHNQRYAGRPGCRRWHPRAHLEKAARQAGRGALAPFEGPTSLYILPGFQFRAIDALITNFHLPRSTLVMLVSAFVRRERLLEAYQVAIESGYRFYSFGDAMLIL